MNTIKYDACFLALSSASVGVAIGGIAGSHHVGHWAVFGLVCGTVSACLCLIRLCSYKI